MSAADMYCGARQTTQSDPRAALAGQAGREQGPNQFRAEGQVRIARAHIGGELNCTGGEFLNPRRVALFADGLKVDGRMVCGNGFNAEGQVYLRRAEVAGQLRFEGAVTKPPTKETEPQGADVAWHLEAAVVGRAFAFKPEMSKNGTPRFEGQINLINAKLGYLRDNGVPSWPRGKYALYGLDFGQIAGPKEQKPDGGWYTEGVNRKGLWQRDQAVTERLEWLENERDGFHAHLYDQLAEHYRRIGHESSERRVLIARQRNRRKELPLFAKGWNVISGALLGYGYRSWQAVGWFALLLVAGTMFFDASHHHKVFQHDGNEHPPRFVAFLYTLDLLLPVINLGQREDWIAKHTWPQLVATALVIAGWILTTTFLAGITGLVRRTNT